MTVNNLIDRYVSEVGNRLAGKEREDIQLELRSTMQDMLDERGLDADKAGDQDAIAEMLKEFGHPEEIANSYRPQRYVIGPRVYPIYTMVLKIVWSVLTGLAVVGLVISIAMGNEGWQSLIDFFSGYVDGLILSLGIVTFIFFALERTGAIDEELAEGQDKEWDPRKLPAVHDPDRVNIFEIVVELVFLAGFIVVLNAVFGLPDNPGPWANIWEYFPAIIQAFGDFIPWMMLLLAAEFVLKFVVLLRGHWQQWSRWLEFLLSVGSVTIILIILGSAPLTTHSWLDLSLKLSLAIALAIVGGDGLAQLYHLIWPQRRLPWQRPGPGSL